MRDPELERCDESEFVGVMDDHGGHSGGLLAEDDVLLRLPQAPVRGVGEVADRRWSHLVAKGNAERGLHSGGQLNGTYKRNCESNQITYT